MACATDFECIASHRRCENGGLTQVKNELFVAFLVKNTGKVTGFVGGAKNRPAPISEAEVQKIIGQMQEGSDKPRHKVEFVFRPFGGLLKQARALF